MKITNNKTSHYSYIQKKSEKTTGSEKTPTKASRNYDEIQIQASSPARSEDIFVKELTGKLSLDVRQSKPSAQIKDLSAQIENHTYSLQLDEVVNRILLQ